MRILIVEDEERLANTIAGILKDSHYASDVVYDGIAGLKKAESGIYDAVILDVMLPGMNGFDVVKELRRAGVNTPVLLLTALFETDDKVRGLDCGADYYLTKPFDTSELLACLRAISRRKGEVVMDELTFCDLSLNLSSCQLCFGDRSIRLGYKEFEVMRLLMLSAGTPLPKETIILKIWGPDSSTDGNNVEVYMSFLRKKLAYLGSGIKISTLVRVGYMLENAE